MANNYNNFRASGGNYTPARQGNFSNNYGNGYNQKSNPNNYQPKHGGKKSKCSMKPNFFSKKENKLIELPLLTAWNYSKSKGLISIVASPRRDKAKLKCSGEKGKFWQNWAVKINCSREVGEKWTIGLFDTRKGKLHLPELNMIANPSAPNGGYFGKNFKR